jgi:hypothetical protein
MIIYKRNERNNVRATNRNCFQEQEQNKVSLKYGRYVYPNNGQKLRTKAEKTKNF